MTVTETIQVLSRRRVRGSNIEAIAAGPAAAVRGMKLHYVTDRTPGIGRETSARGFVYRSSNGRVVRGIGALARIRALAIPPAWTRVWICADPDGHLQAVGRDARGRKQYRYHPRWREHRDETKFEHILAFGAVLPRIRRQVAQHLSLPGLPREKVLAAVVRLMELSLARVGNPEYAKQNHSFGLTTLLNRHVHIRGGQIELDFRANGEGPLGKQAYALGRPLDLLPTEIDRVGETHRDLRILAGFYFGRGSHISFGDSG